MTSTSKATPLEAAKGPLIQPSTLTIDKSPLQIGDNKSFMEAWEEASKLNEEAARLQSEELSILMSLKLIHYVSFLSPFKYIFPISVAPKLLTMAT